MPGPLLKTTLREMWNKSTGSAKSLAWRICCNCPGYILYSWSDDKTKQRVTTSLESGVFTGAFPHLILSNSLLSEWAIAHTMAEWTPCTEALGFISLQTSFIVSSFRKWLLESSLSSPPCFWLICICFGEDSLVKHFFSLSSLLCV